MHRAWHRVAFRFLLALIAIAPAAWLHAAVGDVTTFAGGGGSSAEGATALTAAMNGPHGLYVAPNGDVYYTEEYGHKVRKISGGIVTTVAGTGVEGGAGDGGPATAAQLSYPVGVWGDGVGNLYISEHYASAISGGRVRKIGPAGIISTLAGGGATSPSDTPIPGPSAALSSLGDLVVAPNGNIFVAVYGTSQLVRIDPSGNIVLRASGTGGLGISSSPTGLIYIAGTHPGSPSPGHRVYTWDDATATLTAIAGTGTNAFSGDGGPPLAANMMPQDTVLSGDGTLFIGDRFNGRVRKIAGGIINTQAIITDPKGMAALGADLLVVSPSTIVRIEGVIAPFAPPAPAFTSIVPNNGVRGTSVPVTINGSTLGGVTNLRLHRSVPSPADLNFPVTVPTATALTTTFDLATLGPDWDGLQGVHFSTNGGSTYASTGLTFMINSPPPPPAPAFTSIVPNNGVRGTSVPVTINGSTLGGVTNLRLHRTAPSPADLNFPVTVPTATVLTTTFDLTALGPDWDGLQEVHFSTNGGSTYASAGLTFMINSPPPPAPAFTSIVPNNGVRGTSVPVTINGSTLGGVTNLRLHRSVPSPADLNFPVTVPTATVLTTTFDLTALGPDWDGLQEVHFSTNGGSTYASAGLTFMINSPPPPPPVFEAILPDHADRGSIADVVVTGANLDNVELALLNDGLESLLWASEYFVTSSIAVGAAFDLTALGPDWEGTHSVYFVVGEGEPMPTGLSFTITMPPPPERNWMGTLRLMSGVPVEDKLVTFGLAIDAVDGYNSLEDIIAPPAPPPPSSWLRLQRGGEDYLQDVLAFSDTIDRIWNIAVHVDSGTFYLGVDSLPEGVLAFFNDSRIEYGEAVYQLPLEASIPLNTGFHTLTLVIAKRSAVPLSTTLGVRWQMFSLPGPTTDGSPADLFTRGVVSMYGYNPSPEVQNYYSMFGDVVAEVPGVQVSDDPLPFVSQGWWIFRDPAAGPLPTTFNVDIFDPNAESVDVTLHPRWNMVGVPWSGTTAGAYSTAPNSVYAFDGANYSIVPAESPLFDFHGYWVFNALATMQTVTITQGGLVTAPSIVQRAAPSADWLAPLTISLDSGIDKTVELGGGSKAVVGFDAYDVGLPPAPPIRSYSEFFAKTDDPIERMTRSVLPSNLREATWELSANLAEAGTLRWKALTLPEGYRIIVESGSERHDLSRDGSMRLDAGRHSFTARLSFTAPSRSRLMTNYPNPFNPETWIPFELKEGSAVTVNIYDVAGSLVRTLDLGYRDSGYYTSRSDAAYWDGRNELGERVASGVYFYELRAGSFRETRRMVIHK